jgi:CelD/BcsL family acetyltransferase involved in cellulose biosynthesis
MLNVRVLDQEAELDTLAQEWEALLEQSDADTLFLTWEWVRAWWNSYKAGKSLFILEIRDGDDLVAIVPLYRRRFRKFGLAYTGLHLIGDGSWDSDYLDAIARRGREQQVKQTLADFLTNGAPRYDVLFLNDVPSTSITIDSMKPLHRSRGWHWRETEAPCTQVELPGDWDTYLKRLAPRMRTKVRSLKRDLEKNFDVRYERCDDERDLDARLAGLFQLHALRWQLKGEGGVFSSPQKRRFYREIAGSFLAKGWLRFDSLAVGGRYVAHQFCVEYKSRVFLLQEGFDPQWQEHGVGNVLRAHVLRDCIERGVKAYDFLAGVTPHKLSWGGAVTTDIRAASGRRTLKNLVFFGVPRATDAAKQVVKKVLPESVLAWRRARMT